MLTFPEIVKRTPKLRQENAKYVKLVSPKFGYTPKGHAFVAVKSWSTKVITRQGLIVKKTNPDKYVTVVEFLDDKLHVNLSCSCPDFMYRFEVALHNNQAANIEYSNGELPVMTNPAMVAACCKHCIALFDRLRGVMTKKMMAPMKVRKNVKASVIPSRFKQNQASIVVKPTSRLYENK